MMKPRQKKRPSNRERRRLLEKVAFFVLTFIALFLLSCVVVLGVHHSQGDIKLCEPGYKTSPRNKANPGVFDSLTLKEYNEVIKYLLDKANLSLAEFDSALPNSSYIYLIDILIPLKKVVIKYLDNGIKQPDRTAYVVIVRGDQRIPRVEEYHVGPLPNPSYHTKVTNPSFTMSKIPYNLKPVDEVEYKFLDKILKEVTELLHPLLVESYGLSYHNCSGENDCMIFHDISPRALNENERKSWFGAYRDVEGSYLHPLGLEIQIDHSSTNIKDWFVQRIIYNGNFAYSPKYLLQHYLNGKLKTVKLNFLEEKETSFSSKWRRGGISMEHSMRGPTLMEPSGHRYKVDGYHVSYFKWNMNLRMRTSTGLQVFDIRFGEERIIYELSLQELVTFYSGYGPVADMINTYGTSFLIGAKTSELIPGVDCPETSTFLDTDHFVNSQTPFKIKNSICIFEDHASIPLRRHFSKDSRGKFRYYGGLGNYNLVIRYIVTLWNYDYIFDYVFYLNGAIECRVSISGYLFSSFPLYHEKRYGTSVHDDIIGNVNQQLFHFKIDFDINGGVNRFGTINFETEEKRRQWYHNSIKQQITHKKHVKHNEFDANFRNYNEHSYDIVYNEYTTSKFGSSRAYRIVNNNKPEFLLKNSDIAKGVGWAKFPLAISRFQETEISSSSIYNGLNPWNPMVDFERFLQNNDSLRDTDLVTWVAMGITDIPHTEDIPNIPIIGNQVSFQLLPFNFFTECPSMSSSSAIHISKNKHTDELLVNSFGTPQTSSCVQKENKPSNFNDEIKTTD